MNIPPTLTLTQITARTWPALIVGAGPAGALLAGLLAQHGVAVLLVDRAAFPRHKVCGACLNQRALAALAAAGLPDLPRRLGACPLTSLHLAGAGRAVRLRLPGGAALSREALDAALITAAVSRGADFLPATTAALGHEAAESRTVILRGAAGDIVVNANVVFAADGLAGGLLARAGAPSVPAHGARLGAGVVVRDGAELFAAGTIWMAWGRAGYVGAVRLEDGRLDLACALDADEVRHAGPAKVAIRTLTEAALPVPPRLDRAAWRGTPPLTRQPRRVAGHRLFALGDAAGYVEPFTGEGMAWAMSSAVALTPLALRAIHAWRPDLIRHWSALHRRTVRPLACRLVAAALRRPWLAGAVIALLKAVPGLARPVVAHLNRTADLRPAAPGAR